MSDYFDRFEQITGDALGRRAHEPLYRRVVSRWSARMRLVAAVLTVAVVATPTAAAVTNWFGLGAPDPITAPSATSGDGAPLPGQSKLLTLRVADPQGGPDWAIRQVRTTRGEMCVQVGRVEHGRIGSLGIDGAWNNDGLFHPFPSDSTGIQCGSTDGAGHGFISDVNSSVVANANPYGTPRLNSCHSRYIWPQTAAGRAVRRYYLKAPVARKGPECAPGSVRIVASGLLGPDAKSITYRTPSGAQKTEPTSGPDGAYLLVFTLNQQSCNAYAGDSGMCGDGFSTDFSPDSSGPLVSVQYKDGHVCTTSATSCPEVGYVAPKTKRLTAAELATPLTVRTYHGAYWCVAKHPAANSFSEIPCGPSVPAGYQRIYLGTGAHPKDLGTLIDVSLRAPAAVTNSRSWYDFTSPAATGPQTGESVLISNTNVRRGQILRFQAFVNDSRQGEQTISVRYTQNAQAGPETDQGSTLVGSYHLTVR